jgi:hypothetical protein
MYTSVWVNVVVSPHGQPMDAVRKELYIRSVQSWHRHADDNTEGLRAHFYLVDKWFTKIYMIVVFVRPSYNKKNKTQKHDACSIMPSIRSEISFAPSSYPRRHLYRGRAPVLAMVMSLSGTTSDPRTLQRLFLREGSEDAKDDGHTGVELYAHERLRDAFANVLEVHSCAFDEHPNRNHRVERSTLCATNKARDLRCTAASDRRGRARCADVQPAQQIRGVCTGLDKGSGDHSTGVIK